MVHNYYQQRGGEAHSFEAEVELLQDHGHDVSCYTIRNDQIEDLNVAQLAEKTLWNRAVYRKLRAFIERKQPQLVHFNNTFPLVSPAAYDAARDERVPVVKTIRNYRQFCLNGVFFRDGHVCEDCFGKRFPWPGIQHACYRDSHLQSTGAAAWITAHRLRNTWKEAVDTFVVCSDFTRKKLIEGGLPAECIRLKPNFLQHLPPPGDGSGEFALFVGRLAAEKGLDTLIEAWKHLGDRIPLNIVGDGPLDELAEQAQRQVPSITWLGRKPAAEVLDLMGRARMLVFPSEWYETFGRVAMESFAKGTPVIVSNLGGQAERVDHNRTGRLFESGNAKDLTRQVQWALSHPDAWKKMRQEARVEFENHYTADRNHEILMDIYDETLCRQNDLHQ